MKKNFGEYPPDLAASLVIEHEGFRSKAYLCPAGVWTIGYGHTGGVHPDDQIDMENARHVLASDLQDVQSRNRRESGSTGSPFFCARKRLFASVVVVVPDAGQPL